MSAKNALRAAYLARRQAMTEGEWAARSLQVCQHVLVHFSFGATDLVHLFIPIAAKREIDTWPLIRGLWQQGARVGVPVSDFATNTMCTAVLRPDTELTTRKYGLQEPTNPEWLVEVDITHVFVPLLVVDQTGHRIGYGGGFYDRFLPTLPGSAHKIGLSLESPIQAIPGVQETDVPLHACVTPEGLISF